MKVLLTNDDGIGADGLQALRRSLLQVPGVELAVIAPATNQSATSRSITTRRPLLVREVDFMDGTVCYSTDGTPVDCVRLATLGVVEGFKPELIIAGINQGSNLGDDITYSGTVAAALEGVMLELPAIAVSQQSLDRELDFRIGRKFDFTAAARFVCRLTERIAEGESDLIEKGTLLNINFPGATPKGVAITKLGKRIYLDQLELADENASGDKHYRIYGDVHDYRREQNTDLQAVADDFIAITPLHFDLTRPELIERLRSRELDDLL